ncbi:hypothetical protein [Sphingomonas horti]|uniref:hypothetical protein n=1 Tax=Sphingomonas horti TaxID=2682842 RepID=UPI0018DE3092|nr:hypothetical protein [Sphingomonas horti]
MLVAALVVFGLTALAAYLFGRRLARRSRFLAILACASTVPVLIIASALALLITAPDGSPPNDAPAMLFVALTTVAMLSCIVSIPASALLIRKAD